MIISNYNTRIQSVLEIKSMDPATTDNYERFSIKFYLRRNPDYKAPGIGESDLVPYKGFVSYWEIKTTQFLFSDGHVAYDLPTASSKAMLLDTTHVITKSLVQNNQSTQQWPSNANRRTDIYIETDLNLEYWSPESTYIQNYNARSAGRAYGRMIDSRLVAKPSYISTISQRLMSGEEGSTKVEDCILDLTIEPVVAGVTGPAPQVAIVNGNIWNSGGPYYTIDYNVPELITRGAPTESYRAYPFRGKVSTISYVTNFETEFWLLSRITPNTRINGVGFITSYSQAVALESDTKISFKGKVASPPDFNYYSTVGYRDSSNNYIEIHREPYVGDILLTTTLTQMLVNLVALDPNLMITLKLLSYTSFGVQIGEESVTSSVSLSITPFHDLGGSSQLNNISTDQKVLPTNTIRPMSNYITYEISAYSGSIVVLADSVVTNDLQSFTFRSLLSAYSSNPVVTVKLIARVGATVVGEYSSTLRITLSDSTAPEFIRSDMVLSTPNKPNLVKYSTAGMYLVGYSKVDANIEVRPLVGTTILSMTLKVNSVPVFRSTNSNKLVTSFNNLQSTGVDVSDLSIQVEVVDSLGKMTIRDYDYYLVDTSRPMNIGYLEAYRVNSGTTSTVPTPLEDVLGTKMYISHLVVSNRIVHPVSRVVMNAPRVKISNPYGSSQPLLYDKLEPQQVKTELLPSTTIQVSYTYRVTISAEDDFSTASQDIRFHNNEPPLVIDETSVTIGAYPGTVLGASGSEKLVVSGDVYLDRDTYTKVLRTGRDVENGWSGYHTRKWYADSVKVNKVHDVQLGVVYEWNSAYSPKFQYDSANFWIEQGPGIFTYALSFINDPDNTPSTKFGMRGEANFGTIVHQPDASRIVEHYHVTEYSQLICTTGDGKVLIGTYSATWDTREPYGSWSLTPLIWRESKGAPIEDTRSINRPPSWYFTNHPRTSLKEFKASSTLGLAGMSYYVVLETIIGWNDPSGGYPVQIATGSDGAGGSRVQHRVGVSATAWSAWTMSSKYGHTHAASDITSGTIAEARLPAKAKPIVFRTIGIGGSYNIGAGSAPGGVIVYYSLISSNYLKQFIIPAGLEQWFYDATSTSSIYIRVTGNRIEVSPYSSGEARILGYNLLNSF